MPLNTHIGQVLKGKWTLVKYIAAGACAEVWEVGCSDKTAAQEGGSKTWVAKIVAEPPTMTAAEKKKKRKKASDEEIFARTLSWEHSLYNGLLRDHTSVPRTPMRDDWGTEHGLCYLVMERLGPTLSEAFDDAGRCWPNSVLASYSRQMLQSLKECHERKLLFIDVKPENFMLGLADQSSKVFIADFGVADKYIDSKGAHKTEAGGGGAGGGTPLYKSVRVHGGATPGRRDDLEALAFVMVEFVSGKALPWGAASSDEECLRLKQETPISSLCSGAKGDCVNAFWNLAHDTSFEREPDYAAFFRILDTLGSVPDDNNKAASSSAAAKKRKGKAPASSSLAAAAAASSSSSSSSSSSRPPKQSAASKRKQGKAAEEPTVVVDDDDDDDDSTDDEVVEEVAVRAAKKKKPAAAPAKATSKTATAAAKVTKATQKAGDKVAPSKPKKVSSRKAAGAGGGGGGGGSDRDEENEEGLALSPPSPSSSLATTASDTEATATATASATVSYTYTARKSYKKKPAAAAASSKGKRGGATRGVASGALKDSQKNNGASLHDDSDGSDDDDGEEFATYTATVTVDATATSSHPVPSLESP